jgi:uncharacterized protein YbjT (DUF2867 family)
MKKITVIGATGTIGIPVTKELVKAGFEVTALVRDIDKAKQILPNEIRFVKGDLKNKASIEEALKNAEGLYINISTGPADKENEFSPETTGMDNILEAAKKMSVKRVAYLASFLARNYKGDWWVMKAKKDCVHKIEKSGLPYTIFYPSNFMENFLGGMKQGNKIMIMGKAVHKIWWIAGEDYGRQVANAFKTEKAINKEYPVQGVEAYTMGEAAKVYTNSYTKEKLGIGTMPMGMARFVSIFIAQLKFASKFMTIMNNNVETFEAQSTWDELGTPQITIEKFAKQQN